MADAPKTPSTRQTLTRRAKRPSVCEEPEPTASVAATAAAAAAAPKTPSTRKRAAAANSTAAKKAAATATTPKTAAKTPRKKLPAIDAVVEEELAVDGMGVETPSTPTTSGLRTPRKRTAAIDSSIYEVEVPKKIARTPGKKGTITTIVIPDTPAPAAIADGDQQPAVAAGVAKAAGAKTPRKRATIAVADADADVALDAPKANITQSKTPRKRMTTAAAATAAANDEVPETAVAAVKTPRRRATTAATKATAVTTEAEATAPAKTPAKTPRKRRLLAAADAEAKVQPTEDEEELAVILPTADKAVKTVEVEAAVVEVEANKNENEPTAPAIVVDIVDETASLAEEAGTPAVVSVAVQIAVEEKSLQSEPVPTIASATVAESAPVCEEESAPAEVSIAAPEASNENAAQSGIADETNIAGDSQQVEVAEPDAVDENVESGQTAEVPAAEKAASEDEIAKDNAPVGDCREIDKVADRETDAANVTSDEQLQPIADEELPAEVGADCTEVVPETPSPIAKKSADSGEREILMNATPAERHPSVAVDSPQSPIAAHIPTNVSDILSPQPAEVQAAASNNCLSDTFEFEDAKSEQSVGKDASVPDTNTRYPTEVTPEQVEEVKEVGDEIVETIDGEEEEFRLNVTEDEDAMPAEAPVAELAGDKGAEEKRSSMKSADVSSIDLTGDTTFDSHAAATAAAAILATSPTAANEATADTATEQPPSAQVPEIIIIPDTPAPSRHSGGSGHRPLDATFSPEPSSPPPRTSTARKPAEPTAAYATPRAVSALKLQPLKGIRKRSFSVDGSATKATATGVKANKSVIFHSPSNRRVPIDEIDAQMEQSRRVDETLLSGRDDKENLPGQQRRKRSMSMCEPDRRGVYKQRATPGKQQPGTGAGTALTPKKTRIPDFKAIHQRNFDRMESISDYKDRLAVNRARIVKPVERAIPIAASRIPLAASSPRPPATTSATLAGSSKKTTTTTTSATGSSTTDMKSRALAAIRANLVKPISYKAKLAAASAASSSISSSSSSSTKPIETTSTATTTTATATSTATTATTSSGQPSSTSAWKPPKMAGPPSFGFGSTTTTTSSSSNAAAGHASAGNKLIDRQAKNRALAAKQQHTAKASEVKERNTQILRGVRSNRRFELQMKFRSESHETD